MPNDGLDAPTLRFIGQIQHLEADQHVVGQHRHGVKGLVGDQAQTGRMVQIQAGEHLAKALFLGPFEVVPLKARLPS
jgi:hypothetical protein